MTLTVLPNFPFKDQLTEKTSDNHPPENGNYDCVPTSFAAAIQWYDGGYVSGDELKDAAYGDAYKGPTALRAYIDQTSDRAREKYHITAIPYNSTNTIALVGRIHSWIEQKVPVIATIPSAWATGHPMSVLDNPDFSTHVICFYGEIAGGLEAMNPWKAQKHTGSDAYWQERLCMGQVWAVVREASVATAVIPTGWKDDASKGVLTAPNGVAVIKGFRDYILSHSWAANNTPLAPERVVSAGSIEYGNASAGPGSRQDFRFCSLGWTAKANVYVIAVGQDVAALVQQLLATQKALTTAQTAAANAAKPDPLMAQSLDVATRLKALLGEL